MATTPRKKSRRKKAASANRGPRRIVRKPSGRSSKAAAENKKKVSAKKRPTSKPAVRKWVATVTTDSTHPPEGLFTKDAATIAKTLASKRVSPKGPGHGLSSARKAELEKAKKLLSKKIQKENKP